MGGEREGQREEQKEGTWTGRVRESADGLRPRPTEHNPKQAAEAPPREREE